MSHIKKKKKKKQNYELHFLKPSDAKNDAKKLFH